MHRQLILLFIFLLSGWMLTYGQNPVPETELKESDTSIRDNPINVEIVAGGKFFSFPTRFNGVYISKIKFEKSFSPYVGINFLYLIPKSNKVGLAVSFAYNHYISDIKKTDSANTVISPSFYFTTNFIESVEIKNTLLSVDISFLYFINPAERMKFFIRAGFLNNISLGGTKKIVSEYSSTTTGIRNGNQPFITSESGSRDLIDLSETWITVLTGLGIKAGKSRFEFNYSVPRDVYSSPSGDDRFRITSYGFHYYYSLH